MSKERARRRAEREREAAIRAAARAAEAERRERRAARVRAARARLPHRPPAGRATGVLDRRRRRRTVATVVLLAAVVVGVWVLRPDWPARLGVLVVCVLAFPVVRLLVFGRR